MSIDERPNDNFKLNVPDIKEVVQQHINTQQDPRNAVKRAFGAQHDRQVYNNAYDEYMNNNEAPREGMWNNYLSTNAYALKQNAAHEYAMQKLKEDENPWTYSSSFRPRNPWYDWRDAELKYAGKLGEIGLGTAFFGPSLIENGLVGGLARIGGGYGGSFLGEKALGYLGEKQDQKYGTTWRKPAGEIAGGFIGWGYGASAIGRLADKGALEFARRTGKYLPEWLINTPAEIRWANFGDGAEWQEQKDFLRLPQRFGAGKTYTAPKSSRLQIFPETAFASDVQRQPYQKPWTNLTPLKTVFGSSLNVPDMVDFYKGSKPMLFGDMREIIMDPNFEYFQGRPSIQYNRPNGGIGKFYINQDRLKQTIGAYKDLYTSRLNLPNTATVDDIYNHILSNPAKIDPALNEAENIQDILGLSLGYGIKDAILFKDPYLLDLDGTYKETVPGIFDILNKRTNLKQLKRELGELNGNHITWKFRSSALDDWKTKDKPKINLLSLNEDLPRESIPMWKRVGSIIRKAQSDLDAMNSYHVQNVEEWNKLNGKNFKPVTFRTDIGRSKILSKKDFINWIKQRKTNGPSNDVERVGAMYSPYEDMVYLRDDGISSGAYHDFLHQGQYGMRNPQVTLWRIGQLVDPKKIESLNPRQIAYYLSEQELPVYLRQMGENANINVGDPYPGDAEFDKLLTEYPIFGSATFLKRDTPEEKRLFWRALNGTLFGLTGISLIHQKQ